MRAPDFALRVSGLHRLIFFFATPDGTPIAFVTSWKSGEREGRSLSQKCCFFWFTIARGLCAHPTLPLSYGSFLSFRFFLLSFSSCSNLSTKYESGSLRSRAEEKRLTGVRSAYIITGMKSPLCAAEDCRQPFERMHEFQKYCSRRCATRIYVRLCRARKRSGGDDGGPGGKRQPRLFTVSAMHRRKSAKSVVKPKPKQDGLFPEDGIHATQAIGYGYDQNGELSDVLVIGHYRANFVIPGKTSSASWFSPTRVVNSYPK
jgi:hypothetical protein